MRDDHRPWQPVTPAAVTWCEADDGSPDCPLSAAFDDVYYSREDGLAESRHVFLQGNGLPDRWSSHPQRQFCIGETGFGTGLNFLLTWAAWRALPQPKPALHWLAVERFPLGRDDLARALAPWRDLQPLAASLLAAYPGMVPGPHRLLLDGGRVTLDLWWQDAAAALAELAERGEPLVDAWYLDGFAPARNEAMWQAGLLRSVALLSRPGASFATFTAAGQVRRDLEAAGFAVEKTAGFGRKRERLQGTLRRRPPPPAGSQTPWDLPLERLPAPERVLVIGGGLAGCATAAALARRGVAVTLLEQGVLAAAGSGNEQGILYTRLSRRHSPLVDFALSSFCFASRLYREMLASGQLVAGQDGELCGSFQQGGDARDLAYLATALAGVPELGEVVDAAQAGALLGVDQPASGCWFPGSGWLRPVSVCRALAATAGIEVMEQCGPVHLAREGERWRAKGPAGTLAEAPCAVIATGTSAADQPQLAWLPTRSIRGQTTQLPAAAHFAGLRAALCHEGYIAPARRGEHCIGATFDIDDPAAEVRPADHARNLAALARAVPAWRAPLAALDPAALAGRAAHRCASPDYLPIAGPVPDRDAFLLDFAALRRNARQTIDRRGACLPGLYVNTAHGSRGLSSTPLTAELLAGLICGEAPPLGRALCRALAPARFIIRDLGRNRC